MFTEENLRAINKISSQVKGYKDKEIDSTRFKGFRVPLGVYEQRIRETYMVRMRIAGGVIDLEQLEKIIEVADTYAGEKVHLTTRQDIQFHNVEIDNIEKIIREVSEVGLSTYGTGGSTVRTIQSSPLSGVSKDDIFDVAPYALSVTDLMYRDPTSMNLPRKIKLAFSNSGEDTANATISDLGFIAKIKDGEKGFSVYVAGGLGGSSTVSIKLTDFIKEDELIYYVVAVKELFENEGDRTNRHKARIRFVLKRLGEETFRNLLDSYITKIKSERKLSLEIKELNNNYEKLTFEEEFQHNNLIKQKQGGYYSVYVHPLSGNIKTKDLKLVTDFIKKLPYKSSIRISNTQGFYVRDLRLADAKVLLKITKDFNEEYKVSTSITCAGASTCQLGLCVSPNLLKGIIEEFKDKEENIKRVLPRLFISGCQNSCGLHHKALIGFSGKAKNTLDGLIPMYNVVVNGRVGNDAKLAERIGEIPAVRIPKFLSKLSENIDKSKISVEEYIKINVTLIKELIEEFSVIKSFNESPELYYDLYSENKFSIKELGASECSSGVFDIIKADVSDGEKYILKYKSENNIEDLYKGVTSIAKALLPLKNIDVEETNEVFKNFTLKFIDSGYVKSEVKEEFNKILNNETVNIEVIDYLVDRVKKMYGSLTQTLEIGIEKEVI